MAIADPMIARCEIKFSLYGGELTDLSAGLLGDSGIDLKHAGGRSGRRSAFCRPGLDCSERRPHIAGAVGRSLLDLLIQKAWLRNNFGVAGGGRDAAGARKADCSFRP